MTIIYVIQNKVSFTLTIVFFHILFAVKYLVQQGAMSPKVKITPTKGKAASDSQNRPGVLSAEKEQSFRKPSVRTCL